MLTDGAIDAVMLSLRVALVAMAVSLPVAVLLGYAIARHRFFGRRALLVLVNLPLVLPPVVTGYLLLLALGPNRALGRALADLFGAGPAFHWTGAAIAAGVMAFPLVIRPILVAYQAIDGRLEEAAETLGARRAVIFATVTLPLALPGILAGLALGLAKALGEFGATIVFAANIPGETRTLALAIYSALQQPNGDQMAFLLTAIALAVGSLALVLSDLFINRVQRSAHA